MPEDTNAQLDTGQFDKFLEWLQNMPAEMAKFIEVLKKFYELQGEVDVGVGTPDARPDGPRRLRPGESPKLTTIPVTSEQLDALSKARADAQVKEKAIQFIKGFLMGISIAAGPLGGVVGAGAGAAGTVGAGAAAGTGCAITDAIAGAAAGCAGGTC